MTSLLIFLRLHDTRAAIRLNALNLSTRCSPRAVRVSHKGAGNFLDSGSGNAAELRTTTRLIFCG